MAQLNDAATPSKLTGTKLLFIILGILGACAITLIGAMGLAAALGWKIFEALR